MHFTKVKGILSSKNGMNLFRGCTHGCIYCDSRSKCYQMNHKFEDIEVKENGISLLEESLKRKRKKCMFGLGSMTDPYIKEELGLNYTRQALEIINKFGFGVTLITKSANVSTTKERIEALKILRDEGIPTVVWLTPILPFINDTEKNIIGILNYCKEAKVFGIVCFGMGVTLREGNREYFYSQLDKKFPKLKEQYIREYGNSYVASSVNNKKLMGVFHEFCERNGIVHDNEAIFNYLGLFEGKDISKQLSFFDEV